VSGEAIDGFGIVAGAEPIGAIMVPLVAGELARVVEVVGVACVAQADAAASIAVARARAIR
jgi:hypothetical protein